MDLTRAQARPTLVRAHAVPLEVVTNRSASVGHYCGGSRSDCALTCNPSFSARRLRSGDVGHLMQQLGPLVDRLYPLGAAKLLARLDDARDGKASALMLTDASARWPVGIASQVDKGRGTRKLSTLWVSPFFRGRGGGKFLLEACIADWLSRGLDDVHVTVRHDRRADIEGLILPRGFAKVAIVKDRYGQGQDEAVYQWLRSRTEAIESKHYSESTPRSSGSRARIAA